MTSTEDLVRNALADLAPSLRPTAPPMRASGAGSPVAAASGRRPGSPPAAVALVAVAGASLVGDRDDEPSGFQTGEGNTITTGPDAGQPDDGAPRDRSTGQDGVDAADDGVYDRPDEAARPCDLHAPGGLGGRPTEGRGLDRGRRVRRFAGPAPVHLDVPPQDGGSRPAGLHPGDVPRRGPRPRGLPGVRPQRRLELVPVDGAPRPDGADQGEALDTVQPADGAWRRPIRTPSRRGTGPLPTPAGRRSASGPASVQPRGLVPARIGAADHRRLRPARDRGHPAILRPGDEPADPRLERPAGPTLAPVRAGLAQPPSAPSRSG